MGLISNILSPVILHSLRYGATQDTAHLLPAPGAGFTDDTVRQTMGHAPETLARGLTEMYAGKHTRETYNARAAAQYVPRGGVKFSEESALVAVKRSVSSDEIAQWQQLNEPDATDHETRNAKERARNAIRAERHQDFIATAAPEKRKTGTKQVLSEQPGNITTTQPTTRPAPSKESAPPIRPKLISAHREETSNIDPRLVEEDDLNSIKVDSADLSTLLTQVLVTETPKGHDIDEDDSDGAFTSMAIQALLGDDDPAGQQQSHNKYDFINHYSRINVVNCVRFADQ